MAFSFNLEAISILPSLGQRLAFPLWVLFTDFRSGRLFPSGIVLSLRPRHFHLGASHLHSFIFLFIFFLYFPSHSFSFFLTPSGHLSPRFIIHFLLLCPFFVFFPLFRCVPHHHRHYSRLGYNFVTPLALFTTFQLRENVSGRCRAPGNQRRRERRERK